MPDNDMYDPTQSENQEEREGAFADGRLLDKTYLSKTFDLSGAPPGTPARFAYKVLDQPSPTRLEFDGTEWTIYESPAGRVQIKLLMAREPGHLSRFWIQKVLRTSKRVIAQDAISLSHAEAQQLRDLFLSIDHIPVAGGTTDRIDDDVLRELAPESIRQLYHRDREQFFQLIRRDVAARDVVALAHRREEVARFRRLLDDEEFFAEAQAATSTRKPESVWQDFFDANPWILGTGLSGQLFTSWDKNKLEQVIGGASIVQEGKRADALLRTSGVVRWLTFVEFKTHETRLLASDEYRSGAWPPHSDLVAGVAQSHATVHRAMKEIGDQLPKRAADGAVMPEDLTYLFRPRSYLLVGHLRQLLGKDRGPHFDKIRSFELYRRNLVEPEILTYDELLARAEWMVNAADHSEVEGDQD